MRINHNIAALNTYRQLNGATNAQSKAMEKLSSGLRINRAGDDAAGLAISEKMRAQIKGLDQASANAQDGISMIQTAEGALNETHSILQRMRELATQAANDTNVGVDRNEIQKEMNQLTSEINRIGNTTEFNTQSILKGDGTENLKGTGLDLTALTTSVAGTDLVTNEAKITVDLQETLADGNNLDITLNGRTFSITYDDAGGTAVAGDISGVTTTGATVDLGGATSAAGTDAAISEATADVLQQLIDGNSDLKGNFKVTANAAGAITIEAVKDGEFAGSKGNISWDAGTAAQFTVTADGGNDGTADDALAANTLEVGKDTAATAAHKDLNISTLDQAGVDALVGKGLTINGTQIEFYDADKGTYNGTALGIDLSDATNGATLVSAIVTQAANKIEGVTLSDQTGGVLRVTSNETGADSSVIISDGGVQEEFKATFQVGANAGQSMTIDIRDMRASSDALQVATSTAATVESKSGKTAYYTTSAVVTDGTNNDAKFKALDVSSHDKATAAVDVINDAIEQVSAERSKLGAYQNRLEHTINNLGTSSENLTAAESRIRDVDMAKEIMESTKNGILSQAAQAMLAQANQQPQGVLQLLR